MPEDIGRILKTWPYAAQNSIRKVIDFDGAEKIQVRVDQGAFQGILQMELDGRPDGERPHDRTFALDFYKDVLQKHTAKRDTDSRFTLNREACAEIFDESRRLYERYVFLLQIQDYNRVIRDTERNMDVFRFVNQHAEHEEDRVNLERWWPYILRIHAVARVMINVQNENYDSALDIIREALEEIENLEDVGAEEFDMEKKRSQQALKELEAEIAKKRPFSRSERLQKELTEAIEKEEFEKAAKLRDRIRALEKG